MHVVSEGKFLVDYNSNIFKTVYGQCVLMIVRYTVHVTFINRSTKRYYITL